MAIYDDAEGDSDADSILDCEDGERKVSIMTCPCITVEEFVLHTRHCKHWRPYTAL